MEHTWQTGCGGVRGSECFWAEGTAAKKALGLEEPGTIQDLKDQNA